MKTSSAEECLARLNAKIQILERTNEKLMLRIWRDHWWAEVNGNVDATMRTLAVDSVDYLFDGNNFMFSKPQSVTSREEIRKSYASVVALGVNICGPFDDEQFCFGENCLTCECMQTGIYSGAMMSGYRPALKAEDLYFVRWRLVTTHGYDLSKEVMLGEHVYFGAPVTMIKVEKSAAGLLNKGGLPSGTPI
jgi:hypothetical protein